MYHVLLTNRYLTTRIIPLIAVVTVALCVALVIIVVSVMTGFLDMVKNSGRAMMGDVVISHMVTGLPYYERLIDRIEALPEAEAAAPVTDGWGLLQMPYPAGPRKDTRHVQFWGVDPASFARVTQYRDTLWWKVPTAEALAEMSETDFRRRVLDELGAEELARYERDAMDLVADLPNGKTAPAAVIGMHVSAANDRQSDGSYRPMLGPLGYWWMPGRRLILSALPADTARISPEPESTPLYVANEFNSGVFVIDELRVIIPIGTAQDLLNLDASPIFDDEGEATGFIDPARATMILVLAAEGVTADALRERVAEAYDAFRAELLADETVAPEVIPPQEQLGVQIQTWLQQQARFIAPVEKERELMRILFSIIYLVCAGLVLAIFWAIVFEKTRDIGILRSIGASRMGISFIFLRYGAIIGMAGSILGVGIAWVVVRNINTIHDALGQEVPRWVWIGLIAIAIASLAITAWRSSRRHLLPVVLWSMLTLVVAGLAVGLMLHRGTVVWDPAVYYFEEIPNEMDPVAAVTTVIGGILFSIIGAFVPAAKAADTDPVRALHYE